MEKVESRIAIFGEPVTNWMKEFIISSSNYLTMLKNHLTISSPCLKPLNFVAAINLYTMLCDYYHWWSLLWAAASAPGAKASRFTSEEVQFRILFSAHLAMFFSLKKSISSSITPSIPAYFIQQHLSCYHFQLVRMWPFFRSFNVQLQKWDSVLRGRSTKCMKDFCTVQHLLIWWSQELPGSWSGLRTCSDRALLRREFYLPEKFPKVYQWKRLLSRLPCLSNRSSSIPWKLLSPQFHFLYRKGPNEEFYWWSGRTPNQKSILYWRTFCFGFLICLFLCLFKDIHISLIIWTKGGTVWEVAYCQSKVLSKRMSSVLECKKRINLEMIWRAGKFIEDEKINRFPLLDIIRKIIRSRAFQSMQIFITLQRWR